jgi:hypothetical protein
MKRAPTLGAIAAAEARLAMSRQKTRDGLHRVRVALRASLTRPSTVALAAGAAGLAGVAGVWLARRPRRRRAVFPRMGAGAVLTAYAAPFVQSLLARYGKDALSLLVEKVRAARRTRAEGAAAEASNASMPDQHPIGVPH